MTLQDRRVQARPADLAGRVALAKLEEPHETARRVEVNLQLALVTLLWLVSVSLLLGWDLTGPRSTRGSATNVAAVLGFLLPFIGAVIATKNRRFVLGGVYVVLTLAMVLPAIAVARG